MKTIQIKLHSLVDVITNSSTVIYVQSHDNTIKYAKDLIDSLLKAAGSDKKADDLFTFGFDVDRDVAIERIVDDNFDCFEEIEGEFVQLDQPITIEELRNMKYEEQEKVLNLILDKIRDGKTKPYSGYGIGNDDGGWDTRELIIKPKNNNETTINLTNQVSKIFAIDGGRDD